MASNADADYVEELDIDQELRARNQRSKSQTKAPIFSPQSADTEAPDDERDNEGVPLLSPSAQDYGSSNGRRDSEMEWPGEADFAGLPWWNRPSVRPTPHQHNCRQLV